MKIKKSLTNRIEKLVVHTSCREEFIPASDPDETLHGLSLVWARVCFYGNPICCQGTGRRQVELLPEHWTEHWDDKWDLYLVSRDLQREGHNVLTFVMIPDSETLPDNDWKLLGTARTVHGLGVIGQQIPTLFKHENDGKRCVHIHVGVCMPGFSCGWTAPPSPRDTVKCGEGRAKCKPEGKARTAARGSKTKRDPAAWWGQADWETSGNCCTDGDGGAAWYRPATWVADKFSYSNTPSMWDQTHASCHSYGALAHGLGYTQAQLSVPPGLGAPPGLEHVKNLVEEEPRQYEGPPASHGRRQPLVDSANFVGVFQ